jgi:uncharacterized protein (TIGR00369 family)
MPDATMSASDLSKLQALVDSSPLHRTFELSIVAADRENQSVRMRMPFTAAASRDDTSEQFHGGAIASLIDVAGDFALVAALGYGVPTINFRVDYLRAAKAPWLMATAQVQRAGKSVGVVDISVADAEDNVVALGRGCYSTRAG